MPAGVDVECPVSFKDKESAEGALAALQRRLYPEWSCRERRTQCLLRLLREDELRDQVKELASQPEYQFARPALLVCAAHVSGSATDGVAGAADRTSDVAAVSLAWVALSAAAALW